MKQPDTAAARDRAKRLVKLSKERDMYFTEKDGTRADSVSVRYPAYAGTVLQAKHGGKNRKCQKLNDLTGKRFGTLTVLGRAANRTTPNGNRFTYWLCKCDCGTLKEIRAEHLKAGKIVSCGCQQSKNGTANPAYKHGGTGTRLYYVWNGMHQRCYNPKNEKYSSYGGRGIRVCSEWDDFATFRDWALSAGYDESASYGECTLDRINVNGNYGPDNCRWVNEAVQSRNRTTNIYLTYKGETKVLKDWARDMHTNGQVLKRRLEKGWTPAQVIETPV